MTQLSQRWCQSLGNALYRKLSIKFPAERNNLKQTTEQNEVTNLNFERILIHGGDMLLFVRTFAWQASSRTSSEDLALTKVLGGDDCLCLLPLLTPNEFFQNSAASYFVILKPSP
ncbi:hypothetical protein P5673_001022, partial [Acropora cervicornis]